MSNKTPTHISYQVINIFFINCKYSRCTALNIFRRGLHGSYVQEDLKCQINRAFTCKLQTCIAILQ